MNKTSQLKTTEEMRQEFIKLLNEKAVIRGDITLSSGLKSNFYIDGKQVALDPRGAYLIANLIYERIKDTGIQAIGGLTMGADPIVCALAYLLGEKGSEIKTFLVRKEPKKHGTRRNIEGPFADNQKVAIVDDVITTGTSVLKAIDAVKEYGCRVEKIIVILDRRQGSQDSLKNYILEPLVQMEELELS